MSDRITRADLDRIAATITEGLRGSLAVEIGQRNGMAAADLADERGTIDLLHIGTKRETYTYLQGMRRALLIIGREV